jgi:ABC-type transport system substrate-binding protein
VDDPTTQLSMVTSRSTNDANFALYDDPKVDALLEKQVHAPTFEERKNAYRELGNYMFAQSYYAMAFWGTRIDIIANGIQGYKQMPAQRVNLELETLWLKR